MVSKEWQESIYGALGEATVLIAIVSPSFFNSKHCRAELSYFVHRTMLNEQNAFVVPVVLVETPVLYDPTLREEDELATALWLIQLIDWRSHNHKTRVDLPLRQDIGKLAELIVDRVTEIESQSSGSGHAAPTSDGIPQPRRQPSEQTANQASTEPELSEFQQRWLRACAVYPVLRWPLTVYLGRKLAANGHEPDLSDHMPLARLTWFRQGFIPQEDRAQTDRRNDTRGAPARPRALSKPAHQSRQ